jgi:hypothetical protein
VPDQAFHSFSAVVSRRLNELRSSPNGVRGGAESNQELILISVQEDAEPGERPVQGVVLVTEKPAPSAQAEDGPESAGQFFFTWLSRVITAPPSCIPNELHAVSQGNRLHALDCTTTSCSLFQPLPMILAFFHTLVTGL